MIPQRLEPNADAEMICALAASWKISAELAVRLHKFAKLLERIFNVSIISGYRTPEEQQALRRSGRPTAPDDVSTHLTCPATGADLQPGVAVTNQVIAEFGRAAALSGLRWGGGSPVDAATGFPTDWQHVDLGPRAAHRS